MSAVQEQPSSKQEQRLARFVDREGEMRSFCRMLDDVAWPCSVLIVWGDGGMGKTALLTRMMHETSLRSLVKAEVVWSDTRNHEYLGIMRKIRDDIGAPSFNEFTQLVNFFYPDPNAPHKIELVVDVKGSTVVGENVQVTGSGRIETMAGIVLKDFMVVVPRSDLGIPEDQRMARLTDQFVKELNAVANDRAIVIFLDALEKATQPTQSWVWLELIGAIREGRLNNVKLVIGGRQRPTIDDAWQSLVEERELTPLKKEHIIEFLVKRNVDSAEASAAADWILVLSGGNPLQIANSVEKVFRERRQDRLQ